MAPTTAWPNMLLAEHADKMANTKKVITYNAIIQYDCNHALCYVMLCSKLGLRAILH